MEEISTPLKILQACRDGDLVNVTRLVEEERVDPRLCRDGESGNTPLHSAARERHLDIVRCLVEEGECEMNGKTPLNVAALGSKLDTVQYLIGERGCDPMVRGQYGRTPLHQACRMSEIMVSRPSRIFPRLRMRVRKSPPTFSRACAYAEQYG